MNIENTLRELEFSEYEIKIYISLNKLSSATATQISQDSSVPRNKVYEVIEPMIDKGFIMELPIKPKKYKITSLDKLKEVVILKKEKIDILENETNNLVESLRKLNFNSKSKEPIWIIKGQKNIVEKITFHTTKLKKESLSLFRNNAPIGSTYRNIKEAVDRGVKFKMIGCVNEKSLPKIKKYLDLGVEFRVYDEKILGEHGTRFNVFDDDFCRITIGKPEVKNSEDYVTMWCESESMTRLMRLLFFSIWKKCDDIKDYIKNNNL